MTVFELFQRSLRYHGGRPVKPVAVKGAEWCGQSPQGREHIGDFVGRWESLGQGNMQFFHPYGISYENSGYIYVADRENSRIQKFRTKIVKNGKNGNETVKEMRGTNFSNWFPGYWHLYFFSMGIICFLCRRKGNRILKSSLNWPKKNSRLVNLSLQKKEQIEFKSLIPIGYSYLNGVEVGLKIGNFVDQKILL